MDYMNRKQDENESKWTWPKLQTYEVFVRRVEKLRQNEWLLMMTFKLERNHWIGIGLSVCVYVRVSNDDPANVTEL